MDIKIRSESDAIDLLIAEPGKWDVISIRASQYEGQNHRMDSLMRFCKSMYAVYFDDVTDEAWARSDEEEQSPVTLEQIAGILQWAVDRENLLIHCKAGVSRSTAIAYLLWCKDSGLPQEAVNKLNFEIHFPNQYVVKLGATLLPDSDNIVTVLDTALTKELKKWID